MPPFDADRFKRHYPVFDQIEGPFHYLDNAATAQMPAEVLAAVTTHETTARANIKRSLHRLAERATEAYEQARQSVADYLHVPAGEVIFTSGCTAGLNLVAHGLTERLKPGDEIAVSPAEHHANLLPWQVAAKASGARLVPLPLDDNGCLIAEAAVDRIGPQTRIFAVAEVSNVTGAVNPLRLLASAAHSVGALMVVDGAQGAPHGPRKLGALGMDAYSFSGHKLGAPNGIGALWLRRELLDSLPPLLTGGEMIRSVSFDQAVYAKAPLKFEAGTPPIAQAVGLGAACRFLAKLDQPAVTAHLDRLTTRLIDGLYREADDRLRLIGPPVGQPRMPIVSFALSGIHPHDFCYLADRLGVAVRGGHLCAQPLHGHLDLTASIRASLLPYNTPEDIDALLTAVGRALALLPGR